MIHLEAFETYMEMNGQEMEMNMVIKRMNALLVDKKNGHSKENKLQRQIEKCLHNVQRHQGTMDRLSKRMKLKRKEALHCPICRTIVHDDIIAKTTTRKIIQEEKPVDYKSLQAEWTLEMKQHIKKVQRFHKNLYAKQSQKGGLITRDLRCGVELAIENN